MFDNALLKSKMVVYCFRNLVNGKVYVGKTVKSMRDRWRTHQWDVSRGKVTSLFHRALHKYGEESFELNIIGTAGTNEDLCRIEQEAIQAFSANHIATGYNLTAGGEGHVGYYPTLETRIKLSKAQSGKIRSDEARLHYRNSKTGSKNPQYGKLGTASGTRWVRRESGERKMVPMSEVPSLLEAGWVLGMKPKTSRRAL